LKRHIRTFLRIGKLYRSMEETHLVRLYRTAAILEVLSGAGFSVKTTKRYGDYRLLAGQIGLVAIRQ